MKKTQKKINYFQFLREFEKYSKAGNFFIFGNDEYQKDKIISMFRRKYDVGGTEDFDSVTLYGDSISDNELEEQLESLPFIAPRRFILLRDLDKLSKKYLICLEKYLKKPQKTTILLIIADKIDNRTSLAKVINSKTIIVECKKPYNNSALLNWLDQELKNKKIRMDINARNLLVSNIKLDYQEAENELTKLILYTHCSNVIKQEDVEKTLGKSRDNSVYDLQRSLGVKDLKESLAILSNLIATEDAAGIGVMLVTMLTRYFLTLWKIIEFRRRKYRDHEIIQNHLYEVFYSFRKEYMTAANNFDRSQIEHIFFSLLEADKELKSINMHATTLFLLVYRICNA